jgi:hypothetical protein
VIALARCVDQAASEIDPSDGGALELFRANRTNGMRVTVMRDRSEKDYLLKTR